MSDAVAPQKEQPKSILFSLLDDVKLSDPEGRFRIAIPGSPTIPFLTFRQYNSVDEAEAMKVKAEQVASTFDGAFSKAFPNLEEFRGTPKATIYTAWLLGFLCDELDFADFLTIAREVPILFVTIRDGVNAACVGIDSYLFKGEINAAKKD